MVNSRSPSAQNGRLSLVRLLVSVSLGVATLVAGLVPATYAQTTDSSASNGTGQLCNGYKELCDRQLNKISFVTTHNAFAVGNNPAANQDNSMALQLSDGVRSFMIDAHQLDPNVPTENIELCHTSCALLDAGPMIDGLKVFTKFMDENPREFIVIFIENFDNFNGAVMAKTFDASGLTKYAYYKNASDPWPTLGSLIDQNKRVMFLFDRLQNPVAPWQMLEYDVCWETPYEIPYKNPQYTCNVDRPSVKPANSMYVMNHFLFTTFSFGGSAIPIPNIGIAPTVNAAPLVDHVGICKTQQNNVVPNFVAVDFYEQGSVFSVVASLNGLNYTGNGGTKQSGNGNASDGTRTATTTLFGTLSMGIAACAMLHFYYLI
ncbi:PLC-like phosphodiesterase [Syncephalis fuscata]|nr:PLC-like phosphodiesterase [Syncephalis fuscata]